MTWYGKIGKIGKIGTIKMIGNRNGIITIPNNARLGETRQQTKQDMRSKFVRSKKNKKFKFLRLIGVG